MLFAQWSPAVWFVIAAVCLVGGLVILRITRPQQWAAEGDGWDNEWNDAEGGYPAERGDRFESDTFDGADKPLFDRYR